MILKSNINTQIQITRLEDLNTLKELMKHSNIKINKAAIARELNCDPRTVSKYINGYKKTTTRNRYSPLDEYYLLIKELLSSKTQVFFYKRVLWQYLVDNHNLKCAQSTFRGYISRKPEFNKYFQSKKLKSVSENSVLRFETPAAKQAQLDWKESMEIVLKSGECVTINIFVLLLSYSRFRVYRLSLSKTQDVLLNFLDEAFEAFGGVPQELLVDNMKTVMDEPRTAYKKGKVNNRFKQFADDYGFNVRPCIAGRPNTKAKVEAPMKLLDELHAYNGLLSYEELNKKVIELNDRINHTCHTSTGKIPVLHLEKERDSLHSLPGNSIRSHYKINTLTVTVNPQSLISYKSNLYSVPPEYRGKKLTLQVYDNQIHIYSNTTLVALHSISSMKLNYNEGHYLGLSGMTFNSKYIDIQRVAKENLSNIGALYNNE